MYKTRGFPRAKLHSGNYVMNCFITCYVVYNPKSLTICLTTFIFTFDASALS